jgi:hypothetical protein
VELVKRQQAFAKLEDAHLLARIKKFEANWNRRRQNTSIDNPGCPDGAPGDQNWIRL